MKRRTQIICTLGPASDTMEMLEKMAVRGMNVARINCSHGTEIQHQRLINLVRQLNKQKGFRVGILIDLGGYRIRVGELKKNKRMERDEMWTMSNEPDDGERHIPFDYADKLSNIKPGYHIFIDDGLLQLKVIASSGRKLKLKVLQGGVLKDRKGMNIPEMKLHSNIMTDQDKEDLQFAIENKAEFIAQSFVRNKKDITRVTEMVESQYPGCNTIAKIESQEGVRNVDNILDGCDGVMVARGDLGVTLPLYKIPVIQKYIIRHSNQKKKLSITATQMLESMITNGRPTRAEVSDVANAILDGTDYVMLSGETSIGKYPSRSIKVMSQIIEYTERSLDTRI